MVLFQYTRVKMVKWYKNGVSNLFSCVIRFFSRFYSACSLLLHSAGHSVSESCS